MFAGFAAFPGPVLAQDGTSLKKPLAVEDNGSLGAEMDLSVKRGVFWLAAQQNRSGFWSDADHPALTALALLALEHSNPSEAPRHQKAIEEGFAFLRSCVQADGGIYRSALSNYNTSLSLLALALHRDPRDVEAIRRAREFVVRLQAREMARPELEGGVGYGPTAVSPKRQHPDLDNTLVALEALRASEWVEEAREQPARKPSLDWDAAIRFLTRCQNLPETNPQPWVSKRPSERGGFVYYPGFSNAGEEVESDGTKALRSSGTMSYAGLLSFIYADIPRNDPRITAAVDWVKGHFTLNENPGLGTQGLFYYYHLMAKALSVAGVDRLETTGGGHAWRRELALELINRQEKDGFWVNQTGRWMEKDPVLVTSYALLALQRVRGPR
jgi:squalene-hopene/tetraprenyl-beta-curcumene cyclase